MSKLKALPVISDPTLSVCPSEDNGAQLSIATGEKYGAICASCTGTRNVDGSPILSCWDRPRVGILYPAHGHKLDAKRPNINKAKAKNTPRNIVDVDVNGTIVTITVTTSKSGFVKSDSLTLQTLPVVPGRTMKIPNSSVSIHSEAQKMRYFRTLSDQLNGKLTQIASFNLTAFYSVAADIMVCPGFSGGDNGPCRWCYAQTGNYGNTQTVLSQELRTFWYFYHLTNNYQYLLDTLYNVVFYQTVHRNVYYFRLFDAGDISNELSAMLWRDIISRVNDYCDDNGLQRVAFWLPTQSAVNVNIPSKSARYQLLAPIAAVLVTYPDNVTVRPSTLISDGSVRRLPGFAAGSGVIHRT
jgi:hypothetical protein